jgi:hypothetical protein
MKAPRKRGRARVALVLLAVLVALALPAVAFATVYFSGYVAPGGARCAPSGDCQTADLKTRAGDAEWLTGYWGYVGLDQGSGWLQFDQNTSGSGHVSTESNVFIQCGNSSNATYFMSCSTNNL